MEKEGAGDALEPEKRGRGGVHGWLLRRRGSGRQSRGGEARAVLGLGATCGGEGSRMWRRGGTGAAVRGADGQRQRSRGQSRGAEGRQRKKKRGGGPRGLFRIFKNLTELIVNGIFPLIQSSNEEMTKIEVVEFFKSYNFALELKFRNLKYTALFYIFALNSNLIKFLSLVK
jgi:hypothetical protein